MNTSENTFRMKSHLRPISESNSIARPFRGARARARVVYLQFILLLGVYVWRAVNVDGNIMFRGKRKVLFVRVCNITDRESGLRHNETCIIANSLTLRATRESVKQYTQLAT